MPLKCWVNFLIASMSKWYFIFQCDCPRTEEYCQLILHKEGFYVYSGEPCRLAVAVSSGSLNSAFPLKVVINGETYERGSIVIESHLPGAATGHCSVLFPTPETSKKNQLKVSYTFLSNADDLDQWNLAELKGSIYYVGVKIVSYINTKYLD